MEKKYSPKQIAKAILAQAGARRGEPSTGDRPLLAGQQPSVARYSRGDVEGEHRRQVHPSAQVGGRSPRRNPKAHEEARVRWWPPAPEGGVMALQDVKPNSSGGKGQAQFFSREELL